MRCLTVILRFAVDTLSVDTPRARGGHVQIDSTETHLHLQEGGHEGGGGSIRGASMRGSKEGVGFSGGVSSLGGLYGGQTRLSL